MKIVDYSLLNVLSGPKNAFGDIHSGDIMQFSRVQSSNCGVDISRNVNSSLGTININEDILEYPRINFSFEYLGTNGRNENYAGFVTDGVHGAFSRINDERCLFASTDKDGDGDSTLAIGNCVLESYRMEAAVGDLLKGGMTFVGWNVNVDEGFSGINPTIDINGNTMSGKYVLPPYDSFAHERREGYIRDVSAIGQGQIKILFPKDSAFGMILGRDGKSYEQSFGISVNFERNEIREIGAKYPTKRVVTTPVTVELQTEFLLSQYKADQLRKYYCDDKYDIEIIILSERCVEIGPNWEELDNIARLKYSLKGMKMKSFSTQDSIGGNKTVSISWDVNITDFQSHDNNLIISGSFGHYAYPPIWFRDIDIRNSEIEDLGLKPVFKEVFYKQINVENSSPNFDLEMTGDFYISPSDEQVIQLQYRGAHEIQDISGDLGFEISKEFLPNKTPDGFSKIVYGEYNSSGSAYRFSGLEADYNVGFGRHIDEHSGISLCFVKGNGFNNQKTYMHVANQDTTNFNIWVDSGVQDMHPYEPFYFNRIAVSILNPEFPTGQDILFDIIVDGDGVDKKYSFVAKSPNKKPFVLSSRYQRISNFWIDAYNDSGMLLDNNDIVSIEDHSIKQKTIDANGVIVYETGILNRKPAFNFDGNSWLEYTGDFDDNLSSFALSIAYKKGNGLNENFKLFEFGGASGLVTIFGTGDENLYYSSPMQTGIIQSGLVDGTNVLTLYKNGSGIYNRLNGNERFFGVLSQDIVTGFNVISIGSGFNGHVAEVYMTPFFLGYDFVEEVESYLAKKWIG